MSMLYEILECTYIFVLESVSCSAVLGSLGPHGVQSTRLLSMEFSRQEYWSGQPFPSAGDLPNPGIESGSPALLADSLLSEPLGKPQPITTIYHKLGGLKQTNKQREIYFLIVLEVWSLTLRCQQGHAPSRVSGENLSQPPLGLVVLLFFIAAWLQSFAYIHMAFPFLFMLSSLLSLVRTLVI